MWQNILEAASHRAQSRNIDTTQLASFPFAIMMLPLQPEAIMSRDDASLQPQAFSPKSGQCPPRKLSFIECDRRPRSLSLMLYKILLVVFAAFDRLVGSHEIVARS